MARGHPRLVVARVAAFEAKIVALVVDRVFVWVVARVIAMADARVVALVVARVGARAETQFGACRRNPWVYVRDGD